MLICTICEKDIRALLQGFGLKLSREICVTTPSCMEALVKGCNQPKRFDEEYFESRNKVMNWISVEKELPRTNAECLVYIFEDDEITLAYYSDNRWIDLDEPVTHWVYTSRLERPA